jgi:hypothetical protein
MSLQRCRETGEDFEIVKLRELGADEVERWERLKKKKNPDTGFAGQLYCIFFSYCSLGVKPGQTLGSCHWQHIGHV